MPRISAVALFGTPLARRRLRGARGVAPRRGRPRRGGRATKKPRCGAPRPGPRASSWS
jgi:hypothetical protein